MRNLGQLYLATFGPQNSYKAVVSDCEKQFWAVFQNQGNIHERLQAATAYPGGRWYVVKEFLINETILLRALFRILAIYAAIGVAICVIGGN